MGSQSHLQLKYIQLNDYNSVCGSVCCSLLVPDSWGHTAHSRLLPRKSEDRRNLEWTEGLGTGGAGGDTNPQKYSFCWCICIKWWKYDLAYASCSSQESNVEALILFPLMCSTTCCSLTETVCIYDSCSSRFLIRFGRTKLLPTSFCSHTSFRVCVWLEP